MLGTTKEKLRLSKPTDFAKNNRNGVTERRLTKVKAEREHKETEKKKPKINDFNENEPPPSVIVPRPSRYALQKISNFEFVELWYFSREGCTEASKNLGSQADDSFGLASTDDIPPVASVKASHNAKADHDLSFGDFLQAKNIFLHHIKEAAWPDKHVNSLAEFSGTLRVTQSVSQNGDLITLHYASRVRRQWHDDLEHNSSTAFNISLISESLMHSIAFEINISIQVSLSQSKPSRYRT